MKNFKFFEMTIILLLMTMTIISSVSTNAISAENDQKESIFKEIAPKDLAFRGKNGLILVFKSLREAKEFIKSEKSAVLFDPLPIVYTREINKEILLDYLSSIKYIGPNRLFKLQIEKIERINEVAPNSEVTIRAINATPLLERGYNGTGIKIAIIDSGINNHPDLGGKIILSKSFIKKEYGYPEDSEDTSDSVGHGTYVAGVIAASGTYPGVAPGVGLVNAKVFHGFGNTYVATEAGIIAAIRWSVQEANVDIINLSLGGVATLNDPLVDVVDWATKQGVIVVIAAGNEGYSGLGTMQISTPGVSKFAITVGATDDEGLFVTSYSSRGPVYDMSVKPDLVAPGEVYSTSPDYTKNKYAKVYGTSFAAPHVSGAAALLLSYLKSRNYYTSKSLQIVSIIKVALMATAKPLGYSDLAEGAGLIDVGSVWWHLEKQLNSSDMPDFFFVLPKKLPAGTGFPYYRKLFLGMNLVFNFTLYTSLPRDVEIYFSGNISEVFGSERIILHVDIPFTNWEFNFTISRNASVGYYSGKIVILCNHSSLFEIPVEFYLEMPKGKILFDLRHTSWIMDAKYGQYRKYFELAENLNFAVEQAFWSSKELTLDTLKEYDLVFIPDAASYYTLYTPDGFSKGLISKSFTKREISDLKKYVDSGGFIIFIAMIPMEEDSGNNITNVNELAKVFGVEYKTQPLVLEDEPISAKILETPAFGLGNETVPFIGVPLVITNSTATRYFLEFHYYGKKYYGGALYTSLGGGYALLLSTNYLFDNWAFAGEYLVIENRVEDIKRVHTAILNSLAYKNYIFISQITKEPELGDTVDLNITIVNLTYTKLNVFIKDLIGTYQVEEVRQITDNTYIATFVPRHARYITVIAEVELATQQKISKSKVLYIQPLEINKPELLSIKPKNNSDIRTDLYDGGTLSFEFSFRDDSKILAEAVFVSVFVWGGDILGEEDLSGLVEIPYNLKTTISSDGKEVTVFIEVLKSDIVDAVFLAQEVKLIIEITIYDVNANPLSLETVYGIYQKGGISIFEIVSIAFIFISLVLIAAILLKFRSDREEIIEFREV